MRFHGRTTSTVCCFAFVLCSLPSVAGPAPGPESPTAHQLYDQLNNLAIDPAQVYALRNARIRRDRISIYFNRGFIGFLGKAAGQTTGAVFSGEGEVLLIPPSRAEKASLAQFTGAPILEENFTFAYLRFTDDTAEELRRLARPVESQDLKQPTGFAEQWNPVARRLNPEFSMRVLQDLLGDRDRPYFHAQVQGVDLGVFGVRDDERLPEAVSVGSLRLMRGTMYADVWCSFASRKSEAHGAQLAQGPDRVSAYKIETRINSENAVEGHAQLDLVSNSNADRIVPFQISSRLRVSEVDDGHGQKLEVFQRLPLEESGAGTQGDDWVAVALPAPLPVGSRFPLSFTYQGHVIADVGNGVLFVGARGSWYPNLGLNSRAAYDLTFRFPDSLTLVATGNRVEQTSEGGWKQSRWVTDATFPVAGFNLGPYDSRHRKAGNNEIDVYATAEAEAALEKLHVATQPPRAVILKSPGGMIVETLPDMVLPLAPSALLDSVAESASHAVQYFETLFGPCPYSRLAIAQIPGEFGQGWPGLVYLPTLSFLDAAERAQLGIRGKTEELADQVVVVHEIAHQWWGNEVGWKTPHDQWLSEGFASYAALLYLARDKDGERKARDLLRGYKHDLLSKTTEGDTVESGGPIWLGQRLSNSLNPDGYQTIVYKKTCWVLHMLHVLMTDPATGSDERFFKMLRDFVAAYRGASASTEDFLRHAEKYMPPALDIDRNHHLDWFFSSWVYGTGIPTYKLSVATRRLAPEKYVTQGTIQQSGVPADFEMVVPLVASYGSKKTTLGLVSVTDSTGHFRFITTAKPSRVTIDEDNLLAVVR